MVKKPRILIVENAIDVTGSVTSVLRSSCYLKHEYQYQFVFVLPTGSKAATVIQSEGFEVHYLPMREIRKSIASITRYLPVLILNSIRFARLVKLLKVDLILNNDFYNLLPPFYRAIGGRVPYLCYVRFLPAKFPKALVKTWCWFHRRYSSAIIPVSNAVKRQLPLSARLVVIGNELPVRPASFQPPSSNLILYPSNFIKGKGHEVAIASFEVVAKKFPDWKIRFIGGDMGLVKNAEYKSVLMKKLETSEIRKQVEWFDFAIDLSPHYNACSFVLNFSESESFSNTCLEAMYHGRTVVATRCGGPEEIIDDKINGLLVNVNDVKSMTTAIEFLIMNSESNVAMAKLAYEHVRDKFSAANTVEKLRQLYQSSFLK